MDEFRKKFISAIDDCLKNPSRPDSLVLETCSGRGTIYEIINREETLRKLDALICEIRQNHTILNNLILMNEQKGAINHTELGLVHMSLQMDCLLYLRTTRYIYLTKQEWHLLQELCEQSNLIIRSGSLITATGSRKVVNPNALNGIKTYLEKNKAVASFIKKYIDDLSSRV